MKPRPDILRLLKSKSTRIPKAASGDVKRAKNALDWKALVVLAGIIVAIAFCTFVWSLPGTMVLNDNQALRNIFEVQDWNSFWGQTWGQMLSRPLTQQWLKATYAWDFQSAGPNLLWYHAVNIGLHITACLYLFILLFRVARRLQADGRLDVNPYHLSFAAAAIFSCHPLTVESVAYVAGRAGSLITVNYLLALNCFLLGYLSKSKEARFWGYALFLVFLAIGLNVSPAALTLPTAAIWLIVLLKRESLSWLDWWGERKLIISALAVGQAALPYLIFTGVEQTVSNGIGLPLVSPAVYYASQLKAIPTYYLRCFLAPVGLSFDPPAVLASSFYDPAVVAGAIILALACLGLYLIRRKPILCFGVILFIVGILSESLALQSEIVSDRRFYLPLTGLCLIAGWLVAKLAAKSVLRAAIVCGAIILLLAGASIWRQWAWHSNLNLATATIAANHSSARAHALLALELLQSNKVERAAREAKEALRLDCRSFLSFMTVGSVLLHEKDYVGARDMYGHALELASEQKLPPGIAAGAQLGLAEAELDLKQPQAALPYAQMAQSCYQQSDRLHLLLGRCYVATGKYQMALTELTQARKLNPYLEEVWEPLAQAALPLGPQYRNLSIYAARRWVAFNPCLSSRLFLAGAAFLDGDYKLSQSLLEKVLKESPNNVDALALSSLVYGRENLADKSEETKRKALQIDPHILDKMELHPGSEKPAAKGSVP